MLFRKTLSKKKSQTKVCKKNRLQHLPPRLSFANCSCRFWILHSSFFCHTKTNGELIIKRSLPEKKMIWRRNPDTREFPPPQQKRILMRLRILLFTTICPVVVSHETSQLCFDLLFFCNHSVKTFKAVYNNWTPTLPHIHKLLLYWTIHKHRTIYDQWEEVWNKRIVSHLI